MEIKIQEAMSKFPVAVKSDDSLRKAYNFMKTLGTRHLPVLDSAGNLTGIISDRDFQRAMWPAPLAKSEDFPDGPNATVADYMTWPVVTLPHTSHLLDAVKTMIKQKISAVVIMQDEHMIGILTHEDLLQILATLLAEPQSVTEKTLALAYNSPLGLVTEQIASLGI